MHSDTSAVAVLYARELDILCTWPHSLVPKPEQEEEEKGAGFSSSRRRLIISDLSTC